MIIFGKFDFINMLPDDIKLKIGKIYNLCSPYDYGVQAFSLVPYHLDIESPDFDYQYGMYLMNDQTAFMTMMDILLNVYYGNNAYIGINDDEYYQSTIVESLIKFIQNRYSIIPSIVYSPEDIEGIKDYPLSEIGIRTLDLDRERFYESLPLDVIETMAKQAMYLDDSSTAKF